MCKLDEQVEDIRNAITYVGTLPEVDADKIGLIGWGMAAGLVAKVVEQDKRVKAAAGLNGFYCGSRWLSRVCTYADFVSICKEVEEEKLRFVKEGTRKFSNPFHFYPLDPATNTVVQDNLYTVEGLSLIHILWHAWPSCLDCRFPAVPPHWPFRRKNAGSQSSPVGAPWR